MFNVNSPFWRFLNKMTDQFILSLLWMVCMIPIFTAGASTAAFFSVSMGLQKDVEGGIVRSFFREFKRLFRRGTSLWLLHGPLTLFLLYDVWLLLKMLSDKISWFLLPVFCVAFILVWLSGVYGNAILSRSTKKPKEVWAKAWYMVIAYLPHSFVILVLAIVGVLCLDLQYVAIIAPAMVVYQYARIFNWMFDKKDPALEAILDDLDDESWREEAESVEVTEESKSDSE